MLYDTLPSAKVASWWAALPADHREFFRAHEMCIPFAFYGYPGEFVAGSLANASIQQHIRDRPTIYTEERERRCPEMRWEFDAVVAFGGLEVLSWGKNKDGWGPLRWVAPLQPDDPIDPIFLTCAHNPERSVWFQRFNQRGWLRAKLGRHASLVGYAMRLSQREFTADIRGRPFKVRSRLRRSKVDDLPEGVGPPKVAKETFFAPPNSLEVLRLRLGVSPEEFWRLARCKAMLPPKRMRDPQLTLFEN